MKSEYDVIVVGAGPSGAIAARESARAGLDTLLIEKRQEIGEPVRCAEGIPRDALQEFSEADDKWVCAKISKARLFSPGGNVIHLSTLPEEDTAGYVLDRKIFDRMLAKSAAEAGADVVTKTQATGLLKDHGQVNGIKGKCRGDDLEIGAKIIIGADGIESKVGQWAGIVSPIAMKDIESCAQLHLTNIDIESNCCDFYFGNLIAPGGYAWVFPKGEREANVGLGMIGSRIQDRHPEDYLEAFVNKMFPNSRVLGSIVGAVPVAGMPKRLSCSGVMLVGDSGRLVDPLLGAGIANGMRSGRIAARIAAGAISSGDVSDRSLSRYDREVSIALGKAISRNYHLKEIYRHAGDTQIEAMLRSLKALNAEHISLLRIYHAVCSSDTSLLDVVRTFL